VIFELAFTFGFPLKIHHVFLTLSSDDNYENGGLILLVRA